MVLDSFRSSVVRALNLVNEFYQRSRFESWPKLKDKKNIKPNLYSIIQLHFYLNDISKFIRDCKTCSKMGKP